MLWGPGHDWLSLAVALLVQTVSILKGGSFDCSAGVYRFVRDHTDGRPCPILILILIQRRNFYNCRFRVSK
jgi:hypothetical protein